MKRKSAVSAETFIFLAIFIGIFVYVGSIMGVGSMFGTIMSTAHALLMEVVFYIMAVSILAGAVSAMLADFGVIALVNKLISPIMRPLYGLPGAASLGIMTTFISDNPAILTLASDTGFRKYFKEWEIPALTNLGTAFGMGLILTTYMIGLDASGKYLLPVGVGVLGAVIGSIFSVRIMLMFTKKAFGIKGKQIATDEKLDESRMVEGSIFERVMNAILAGGKNGVQLGLAIAPGTVFVCSIVMLLTFGPVVVEGVEVYNGGAYQGIALLPALGNYISPVLEFVFGFKDSVAVAFPLTALGATGAAMGLVPKMLADGAIGANEIAVFTAMGMCWSGYLSTHVSMMDSLGKRQFIGPAIFSHTIGGIMAGFFAHWIFVFVG